jgi:hypothetical protein
MSAKGIERALLSSTIETSFREPDFVDCLAVSITRLSVSCYTDEMKYCYN